MLYYDEWNYVFRQTHMKRPNPPSPPTQGIPPKGERKNAVNQTLPQKFMQPPDCNPYLYTTDGKHLLIAYIYAIYTRYQSKKGIDA